MDNSAFYRHGIQFRVSRVKPSVRQTNLQGILHLDSNLSGYQRASFGVNYRNFKGEKRDCE